MLVLLLTLDQAIRAYSQAVFEFTEVTFPYIRDKDMMIINFFMPGYGPNFLQVLYWDLLCVGVCVCVCVRFTPFIFPLYRG